MLRSIFVAVILAVGFGASLRGPFYALLFYLWLAYFRPDGWLHSNWISGLRLSLVVGALTAGMALLRFDDLKVRLNIGVLLLLAALAQTMLSSADSIVPDWSWQWWTEFSKVLIIGLFITMLVNTVQRFRATLLVIVLSLGFEAVKQGWVQLLVNPGGTNNNPHFVLGDNNGVALGMFMLAPLAGALVATSSGVERRWHTFFLGGIVLRGISTYSRGGLLTAIAVGLHASARSRHKLRVMTGVACLACIILFVMPDRFWDRMSTIGASSEERDASSSGRLHFWEVAMDMAAQNPFTGVGFNAFSRAYDAYDTSGGLYGNNRAVHSTWFGMLAENGFPGFVLFLLSIFNALWNTRVALRLANTHSLERVGAFARGVQGSLLGFCVGGTFVNGHYNELLWHLFALAIALRAIAEEEAARATVDCSTEVAWRSAPQDSPWVPQIVDGPPIR